VSPLNSRTTTKWPGVGGFNSSVKDLIPVAKGSRHKVTLDPRTYCYLLYLVDGTLQN